MEKLLLIQRLLKRPRRRKIIACAALGLLLTISILKSDSSPDLYFLHWGPFDNISCHYSIQNDALPSAEGSTFSPPPRSIFFHKTSCEETINSREACAVESAARRHPEWEVYVLFSGPITKYALKVGRLAELLTLGNVKFGRIHLTKYAKGTPLEAMVTGGALNRTKWRISHTSDVLRYLTLYKWGGLYLDMDVVVARPLGSLARNWAARENGVVVSAGVLSFSRDQVGRRIADAAVRDLNSNYRGDVWNQNGPGVMTRILKEYCSTTDASSMSAATCNGFEVYGPQFFYPIAWTRGREYFVPGELTVTNAYIYHMWGHVTRHLKIQKDSPYAKLAKRFCPTIYKSNLHDFGM